MAKRARKSKPASDQTQSKDAGWSIDNLPDRRKTHKIAQWKPIMDASLIGSLIFVEKFLRGGADPNVLSTTPHRYRPLHRAIEHKKTIPKHDGHEKVVRLLLEHGADPKLRATAIEVTALQLAAMHEPRFVPLLRKQFEPLDIFHAAAVGDAQRVLSLLQQEPALAKAVDVNGFSSLHYCAGSAMFKTGEAAAQALIRIAQTLRDAGANPNGTYLYEQQWPISVLYQCSGHHNNPFMTELLLRAGADPCDDEAVYHASDEGHAECLALFERYVDPKKLAAECTKCLNTQLHYRRTRGLNWLLEHGADPNWVHPLRKRNAIEEAKSSGRSKQVIQALTRATNKSQSGKKVVAKRSGGKA